MHYEKFQDGTVKCIENEIPFEVPEGWAWARIVSVASIITDGEHKTPRRCKAYDGNYLLSARNIQNGHILLDNVDYVDKEEYLRISKRCNPRRNDVLISCSGSVGRVTIIEDDNFYVMVRSVAMVRFVELNPQFEMYVLQSWYLQNQIQKSSKQTAQSNLFQGAILNLLIPVPPAEEQRKNAKKIAEMFAIINTLENDRISISEIINHTKSKILDLAIRGKLVPQDPDDEPASVLLERIRAEKEELIKQGKIKRDKKESIIFKGEDNSYYEKVGDEARCIDAEILFDIPENWTWCRLSHISEIIMGSSPSSTDICDDEQYIEFHQGKICFTDKTISGSGQFTKSITKIASPNSVLLCVRAPVGEVNITDRNICIGRGLASLKPYKEISEIFLFYWLQAFKSRLVEKATGTTFIAVTTDVVKDFIIPLPPYNSQISIIKTMEEVIFHLSQLEKSLN